MRLFPKIVVFVGSVVISALLSRADVPSDEEVRRLQLELSVENVRMSDPSSLQQQRLLQRELFEKTRSLAQVKLDEKELVKKLTSTGRYSLPRTDSEKPVVKSPLLGKEGLGEVGG